MRVPAEVIQVAIDDKLREASPFYEAMARPHIPALDQAIEQALTTEGYTIIDTAELDRLRLIEQTAVKKLGMG